MYRISLLLLWLPCIFHSCIKDGEFNAPPSDCKEDLATVVSYAQVKALYTGELLQIQEDWSIEGYVVSSDRAGNFFKVLHFQENPTSPTEGFQIEIDMRDSHLRYPVGKKLFIKLKGLYLGKSRGVFQLGGTFAGFGTVSVGRLPALKIPEHILLSCDDPIAIVPAKLSIPAIDSTWVSTLVRFEDMEVNEAELDSAFARAEEATERGLVDCGDNELILRNSGFADFQNEPLPPGNGSITGVLLQERSKYFLAIRDLEDVDFSNTRCEALITEFTSNHLFFSELADPDNNANARFIEVYNAAEQALDLNGWTIRRYTNANTTVSSTIDLTGLQIGPNSTLIISPNSEVFEAVYGFPPDLGVGGNSPADSNGDDNLELVDPFGTVIDVFGVVGADGSGTNHEFEDGKAVRNSNVTKANPSYLFSEWTLFNDTGASGTINLPQNAPEDFSPGSRN
ncbi:MAG: DUF5689 domain-containing protein [Bacteroidota bacterium]